MRDYCIQFIIVSLLSVSLAFAGAQLSTNTTLTSHAAASNIPAPFQLAVAGK